MKHKNKEGEIMIKKILLAIIMIAAIQCNKVYAGSIIATSGQTGQIVENTVLGAYNTGSGGKHGTSHSGGSSSFSSSLNTNNNSHNSQIASESAAPTPEPSSMILMLIAVVGVILVRKKRILSSRI